MSVEKRKIPSTKGNLDAVVQYPEKSTKRLAILCPGYLDSKDYKHLVGLSGELSKKGYTVVRFNPTGTWESEGEISDYTTTQYLEDVKNVLDCMLKENAYTHVLLGGHSRGGQVSLLYAARDARVSLVLAIMPSSGPVTGRRREFSHVEDRDKHNVVEEVKKITVPVILIAGELDEVVLPEAVKKIFDNANEPKKFITIPGVGHGYGHNDEQVKIVDQKIMENFGEKA